MRKDQAVAIALSDIHLTLRPPIARSSESDWLEAQRRVLDQVSDIQEQYGQIPILCAGDIFDRWNPPVELVNWAISNLPRMFAIPGQHDLPNHRYKDIHRSAYWTLVSAGVITNLDPDRTFVIQGVDGRPQLNLWPFPWGTDIGPYDLDRTEEEVNCQQIAIIHKYAYDHGYSYPGAGAEGYIRGNQLYEDLRGYDIAVFGDNHLGWKTSLNHGTNVVNCGSLMRRKADESGYEPAVWIIYQSGAIIPKRLDCSKDEFLKTDDLLSLMDKGLDFGGLVESLQELGHDSISYQDAVMRFLNDNHVAPRTKELVLGALEDGQKKK